MSGLVISGMVVRRLPMTLSEPYAIAYQHIERFENLVIEVHTVGGLCGLGVAAPDLEVTGETVDGAEAALRDVVEPIVRGTDGAGCTRIVEAVRDALPHAPSVRAAIDMALVDLVAKAAGVPAWRLLGGYRGSFPTSVTVGILPMAETLAAIDRRVAEGFTIIKVKGGVDVELDIERLHAIRGRFGPALELRFDANCGYTRAEALHFAAMTADVGIAIYEQPVRREALQTLGDVALATGMSVMADESVMNARDCFRLGQKALGTASGLTEANAAHEQTLVDMVNIKLMKVGGFEDAHQVSAVARAAGIESMVGCMDECELAIAGSLAFALSRRNVTAVDLDGHLDVLGDFSAGRCLTLSRGVLVPHDAPGFGIVRLDD